MKKAIYAGSFDPFTIGHLDIVKRSSKLFDEVHIVIGINAKKKRTYNANNMVCAIKETLNKEGVSNCIVTTYDDLIAKYCLENDISYTIRGLRNSMDYEYEENIAEVNKLINPTLETIYLRTNHSAISSSMVKEMASFNVDIKEFVSEPVLNEMNLN